MRATAHAESERSLVTAKTCRVLRAEDERAAIRGRCETLQSAKAHASVARWPGGNWLICFLAEVARECHRGQVAKRSLATDQADAEMFDVPMEGDIQFSADAAVECIPGLSLISHTEKAQNVLVLRCAFIS